MSSTFTADLVIGFAELLRDAGIGLAYPASTATGGAVGIYAMTAPESPDRVVTLSPYPLSADATLQQSLIGLQVRTRGTEDPRTVWSLDDSIQDVLLGRFPLLLPTGVRISTLTFGGSGSLGQDGNHRWMWSTNYQLSLGRPGPHRN